MQRDIHLTCVRRMDMYMLCITGSVAWFWGDVCAPQVCLEGNCFTVCGDLHAILCAVKRQASVVHRRVLYSVTGGQPCRGRRDTSRVTGGQAFMEMGQDFEGWQEFAGGWVFCWRTVSMEGRTLLEDAVSCTSLCVRMMELRVFTVYVLCNCSVCMD